METKFQKINKRATEIQIDGGKRTITRSVYNIMRPTAVSQAAKELRAKPKRTTRRLTAKGKQIKITSKTVVVSKRIDKIVDNLTCFPPPVVTDIEQMKVGTFVRVYDCGLKFDHQDLQKHIKYTFDDHQYSSHSIYCVIEKVVTISKDKFFNPRLAKSEQTKIAAEGGYYIVEHNNKRSILKVTLIKCSGCKDKFYFVDREGYDYWRHLLFFNKFSATEPISTPAKRTVRKLTAVGKKAIKNAKAKKSATKTLNFPIDERTAEIAWNGAHMSSYKKGSATKEYQDCVDAVVELANKRKKQVDQYWHAEIDRLVHSYAKKLADWTNSYYRNEASCPSVLITGASNFPVRKKHKQNERAATLYKQKSETIDIIRDKIRNIGGYGYKVDVEKTDAVAMLERTLKEQETLLEKMKAANAYFRKHKTIEGCPGLSESVIKSWKKEDEYWQRAYDKPFTGFAGFQLTSIREKIKRTKANLEKAKAIQTAKNSGTGSDNVIYKNNQVEIIKNIAENRYQIIFAGIPSSDVRNTLKRRAFKWSPSNKAWQRQITNDTLYTIKGFIKDGLFNK